MIPKALLQRASPPKPTTYLNMPNTSDNPQQPRTVPVVPGLPGQPEYQLYFCNTANNFALSIGFTRYSLHPASNAATLSDSKA